MDEALSKDRGDWQKLRVSSVLLDGEGVVCDDNGLAIFDKLHSKTHDASVILFAFDILELGGTDYRRRPLEERKTQLRKMLGRGKHGIYYNEHITEDGNIVFQKACQLGCEGIVAKRIDSSYRSGPSKAWIKIKNPKSPAMLRIEEGTF